MKVYLRTFGCRANHYDTEAVRAMLESGGHAIVTSVGDADAAVFNSCAVTAGAEADLRQAVRRAARRQPDLKSVVMGCAAALDDGRPPAMRIRSLPTVHDVVGGADLSAVASALGVHSVPADTLTRHQSGTRALLRIQDGCDEHCTFCATTMARGANRSRPPDEIVREAAALADGHSEIVITGIHIGTYGADIGTTLGALMTRLVRDVASARFRLSSIEATEICPRLEELLVGAPTLVAPHVHAPLQSGSDRLLRRMGRHWYTIATYSHAVDRLARSMPVLGLGADVIAGFPGETDGDHAATLAVVDALPFTYLHVFRYSARPGTAAERLTDRVHASVAESRAAELRARAAAKAAAYTSSRAGGLADVVVIGAPHEREAMTGDYLSVSLDDGGAFPRGARFPARLVAHAGGLAAIPVSS
ncbi:MAG TPA: MiaB/RimO family radical SAM methylthiotransferase [Gemmatimonadaceae bacterium]|nr:MiaB/RimO family radical SAM methylthiotransferase [Gemmatimonadaceae bacterium]